MTLHKNKVSKPKLLMVSAAALLTFGCTPPENIFTPVSGTHFNANSGTVTIEGLTLSSALCYTTDGSEPIWNNGTCAGGTTQRIQGPITFASIPLSCGDDTGNDVQRTVKVQYDWNGTEGYNNEATYLLNCSDDDPGNGDPGNGDPSDNAHQKNVMNVGQHILNDQYLVANNGLYRFYLQGDGNLVLRDWQTRESLWSSGTHGENGARLVLQNDSNLVLYTADGSAVWASNTVGSGADRLQLNDDGSLALYQGDSVVWSQNGSGSNNGGGGNPTGSITHIGTTEAYDSNGQDLRIDRPSGTQAGDLLVLAMHRTDDYLPLAYSGWNRAAECLKRDNGYDCVTYDDCESWRTGSICESFGDYGRGARDLAQVILFKRASSNEPSSYTFDLNPDSSGHPGWAILTTLRGANTTDPIRDWANEGCDNNSDSLFPSVYGEKGDMVLLSQSFDDAVAQSKFNPPDDTTTFGYVSQSDEAGFLFGGILDSTGETGSMKTHGDGASSCKDALVSLTIKPE